MSDLAFPTLTSNNWKLTRTPQWLTKVQLSASGVRCAVGFRGSPLYKWSLKNGVLQSAADKLDLQAILNFIQALQGPYDSFLYTDPEGFSIGIGQVRVAFLDDAPSFDRFANHLWQCGKLEFSQVKT